MSASCNYDHSIRTSIHKADSRRQQQEDIARFTLFLKEKFPAFFSFNEKNETNVNF